MGLIGFENPSRREMSLIFWMKGGGGKIGELKQLDRIVGFPWIGHLVPSRGKQKSPIIKIYNFAAKFSK